MFILRLIVAILLSTCLTKNLSKAYPASGNLTWTGGSFNWPSPGTKTLFKNSGRYVSKNIIATRAQISKDQLFLVFPRFKPGIPVTLARTRLKNKGREPILEPFPSWSMQEEGNCQALQSVVDSYLDSQDILWVLDVGVVNTLEQQPIRRCPPKVVAFSTKTRKILKVIELNRLDCPVSRLQYLAIDYTSDGRCFVYVSDAATRAILVYDVTSEKGFRVVLPKAITADCPRRDVLYLALIHKPSGTDYLYFTYLGCRRMFGIKTEFLRLGSTVGRVIDVGPKPNKMVILGTDNKSSIFFRYANQSDVFQWDTTEIFKQENFQKVYSSGSCQFPTHVLMDYKRGRMQVLESNFPDYIQGTVGCGAIQRLNIIRQLTS